MKTYLILLFDLAKRKKSAKSSHHGEDINTVMLRDVFGVNMKKRKSSGGADGDGMCLGKS